MTINLLLITIFSILNLSFEHTIILCFKNRFPSYINVRAYGDLQKLDLDISIIYSFWSALI